MLLMVDRMLLRHFINITFISKLFNYEFLNNHKDRIDNEPEPEI